MDITNRSARVSIIGEEGNDYIYNVGAGSDVTILANGGDDTVINMCYNVSIDGGAGNDQITNRGRRNMTSIVTINGGAGNDSFLNYYPNKVLFQYTAGDGNDTITGFNEYSTLSIGGGTYTSEKSGDDLILNVGDEKITLEGAATLSNPNIIGTGETVNITNHDNDTLIVSGNSNTEIENYGSNVTINAGGGNDSISNSGSNVTINGNAGNDSISLSSDAKNILIQYAVGDGNDLIQGFRADSTISVAGGELTSIRSGNDIILTVDDDNITLKGAANLSNVNIVEGGINIGYGVDNISIVGRNGNDTIRNSGSNVTILTNSGNDSIWNNASNVTIKGGAGNDTFYNHSVSIQRR